MVEIPQFHQEKRSYRFLLISLALKSHGTYSLCIRFWLRMVSLHFFWLWQTLCATLMENSSIEILQLNSTDIGDEVCLSRCFDLHAFQAPKLVTILQIVFIR